MTTPILSYLRSSAKVHQNRKLFWIVAIAFNTIDAERLKLVGPDRLCAEWVLKNGGGVSLVEEPSRFFRDYNALPPESRRFRIKSVDASNSSIMKIGLEHLKSCHCIDSVIFHKCKHLEGDGLKGLIHIKDSLKLLEISSCYNISDSGFEPINKLNNLETLIVYDMPFVKHIDKVIANLKMKLPSCDIKLNKNKV